MYETTQERTAFIESLFQFRLERLLGQGAFGLAILVFDETEKIRKVFKLPKDEATTRALKVEGANLVNLRNLKHQNIILLHQYGKTVMKWNGRKQERYYLLLAYGGVNLRSKLGELKCVVDRDGNAFYFGSGKQLTIENALRISLDVCQGLEAAHGYIDPSVRILHRDIKPENILIDEQTGVARIADFGISRVMERSSGLASAAGTLLYMDPECFQGRAKFYSDLYSLAVVMYEMFTGELPFENFPVRLQRSPGDPRTHNPEIPEAVARIILKGLENNINQRYQSAGEMLTDLRHAWVAVNPLPENMKKVRVLNDRQWLCEEIESGQQRLVRFLKSEAAWEQVNRELMRVQSTGLSGVVPPLRCYQKENLLGIVAPIPIGRSLLDCYAQGVSEHPGTHAECCQTMARLCDVLTQCHSVGLVHGCLGPDAVFISPDHNLQVHDLGLATVLTAQSSAFPAGANAFRHSFGERISFMSPQLLEGGRKPEIRDDIFAVGAMLYRFLTGKMPYSSEALLTPLTEGHSSDWTIPNAKTTNPLITRHLDVTLERALQRKPEARFESMQDLAKALRDCKWPEDLIASLIEDAMQRYESGDLVGAYDLLDKALYEDPGNAEVHYTRGRIYFRERDYKWAVEELQKAVRVNPTPKPLLLLAECLLARQKDYDQAVEIVTEALRIEDQAAGRELLARVLWAQEKHAEARQELERALALDNETNRRNQRLALLAVWHGLEDKHPESPTRSDSPAGGSS